MVYIFNISKKKIFKFIYINWLLIYYLELGNTTKLKKKNRKMELFNST